MPNPFRDSPKPNNQPGVAKVTDSILVCDRCFEEVSDGDYYIEKKLLVFKCSNGHVNNVRIDLGD